MASFIVSLTPVLNGVNILTLTLNDWVDILIIAVLVYVVLRLLLEQRSLSVAIGVVALALLYWAATYFGLPLTHLLLKTFFSFFIIFLAIIFQKELRRLFSFVGFFSFQRSIPPTQATIETISQAAGKMSARKIGALIVFPGRESISRHFEKGIPLHGHVSQELLLSIFSEETPGHDGAIIIQNNNIVRFGVHLPLAEDAEVTKFSGLRHRAAIGLSERSDAFVLVVSGETGSIDVARNGGWEHCANEQELQEKLMEFSKKVLPKDRMRHVSRWITRNALTVLSSLVIASIAWIIFFPNFAPTQKDFSVPLEFQNVPAGYVVQDVVPREAVVTLQGQSSDFDSLTAQSLDVSVDLSFITTAGWQTVPITVKDADAPLNFTVIKAGPSSVQVDIVKE